MNEYDFSDVPAEVDLLDNKQIHEAFAELIKRATRPFVMAVIGPWGSGKTTLVNHSLEKLKKHYHIAEFNAWSHSKGMPLLKGLFAHLATQKGGIWNKAKTKFTELAKSPIASATIRGAGSLVGPIGAVVGEALVQYLPKPEDAKKKGNDKDQVEVLLKSFKDIANIFEDQEKPLLMFIDDLDRCTPTEALDLIDDIKVYLTIDAPVVFIVALDRRTLEMGIKAKYGLESEVSVDEYLHKIFSHAVYMPEYILLDDFIKHAIKDVPIKEDIDLGGIAKEIIRKYKIKNIRTIKRVVRKWALLIPSNINKYLREAGVEDNLKSEIDELAKYILLLCMLLELYPEYYEILRSGTVIDSIINSLAQAQMKVDVYFRQCLRAEEIQAKEAKERIPVLRNKEPIFAGIAEGLYTTKFLSHENIGVRAEAYRKALTELVKAVHLGIPLIA